MPRPKPIATKPATIKDKLKIGLVLDDTLDTPDGVQQYVLGVGGWLRQHGHEVRYLVGQTSRTDVEHIYSFSHNVKVSYNQNRMSIPLPASMLKIKKLLKAEQFDVLHVQTPYSPMLGARIIKAAGPQTAVVGTFHIAPASRLVHHSNRALALWVRRSLKRFDAMVSVSQAAQAFAKHSFHLDSRVVPNVFDYQRFHKSKAWAKYKGKTLTILYFGRLVPRKGVPLLLEAASALKHQTGLPAFRVVICGKGPLAGQLKQYAKSHDIDDIVEFTGFISEKDKPKYYASADVTVFPSTGGESFGIVLLEGMASGHAAVLAGDNPGYRSVMGPQPSLLFDPTNADELADRLAWLLKDAKKRKVYADWGENYARQFDVGAVGPQLIEVYRQALRKRRGQ